MKYLIRSVKYFIYICLIVGIVLTIFVAAGFVSPDINVMFKNGWKSVWMILAMFACVSCFYPRFGYTKRRVNITGDLAEKRGELLSLMQERGYVLESEEAGAFRFRSRSTLHRITRMWEDRITIESGIGVYIEGLTKDVLRVANAIEYRFPDKEQS